MRFGLGKEGLSNALKGLGRGAREQHQVGLARRRGLVMRHGYVPICYREKKSACSKSVH